MAKIVNTLETGLVKVNNKTKQPKNSYSYALNTVPNNEITDRSSRTNEKGFDEYITLKEEPYHIIGHQWLGDEQYVFFIKHIEGSETPFNEIWYVDIKEQIQELKYANLGLNFKEAYPITSTYRTDYRNHRLIYWVDGLNDDRVIDIDNPDILSLDLSMISMNSSETKANVNVLVKDGGVIKTGQYFVAAAYEDETGYVTSPSGFSNAVSISTDSYFIDLPVTQHYNRQYINTDGSELNILSNKSLSIEISDIDTRYTNLIIYIVLVTDTDTIIYTTDKLPINSETYTFIFNGLNVEEDSTITLNDLVVSRINYYASNIINQKENRLIRGNLKIKENLIDYQQIANNIQVNYSIDRKLIYNNNIVINFEDEQFTGIRQGFSTQNYAIDPSYLAKTGDVSITSKTFMRDEVYAFGISFELNDGTETDVFHIPGRKLNTFVDSAVGTGEYNRSFTNQSDWDDDIINSNPRWLEMNTAIKRGDTNNELAYWRSDEVYPDGYGYPTDGETDSSGKSYVRHHKMPSDVLEPLYDVLEEPGVGSFESKQYTVYARYIKLNFSNIAIPEEYTNLITKVILHYVPRTDQNKSIISKGLIFSAYTKQPYQFNIDGESINDRFQFNSPDIDFRFKEFPITADRLKINSVRKGYVSYYGQYHNVWNYVVNIVNRYYGELNGNNPPYQELLVGTAFYLNSAIPVDSIYSRNIENIIFTDPNSRGSFPDSISTYDFSGEERSSLGNIEAGSPINISYTDYPDLNYDFNSINNLYTNVNYQASRTEEYELQEKRPLGTYYDTVLYGSLVRDNRTQYGNVNNLIYSKIGHKTYDGSSLLEIDVNNGDCFIEVHHARKGYSIQNSNTGYQSYVLSPSGTFTAASPIGEIKIDSYISYITETDLNIRMRNTDPNVPSLEDNYYPISPLGVPFTTNFNIYTIYERKTLNQEYFNIYPAYNNFNLTEEFANKRLLSEFNNPESNKYENRLVYSDKQNYEDKVDNFRITRANNYKDLPMNRGQITQSFIKDDKFFVITRDALFNVYASNKTIQSIDNDNIVVGTGEFFGLEPVELISIEGGFGGTSSKYSLTESPYGYLFVDRLKSKAILFNETLKDINVGGLNEDYTLNLYKQFKELELEDKFDNPIVGPGVISIYDPRLHRFIITKKDYIALEPVINNYKGLYNPNIEYNIGDIVAKDGLLVEITDVQILPEEKLLFRTDSSGDTTVIPFQFNRFSGGNPGVITVVVKQGNTVIKEVNITTPLGSIQNIDVEENNVDVYIRAQSNVYNEIYQFDIPAGGSTRNGIYEVYPDIFPNLTVVGVYNQSLNNIIQLNTSISNLEQLEQLLIFNNNLSGTLNVSNKTNLTTLEFFNNSITSISGLTTLSSLVYFNGSTNPLTGTLDFTSSPDVEQIFLLSCNITGINITGRTNLVRLEMPNNHNCTQVMDFTTCPNLEVFDAENCPFSDVIFSSNTKIRGLFLAGAQVPQASIQSGINSNKATLEAFTVRSDGAITSLNFDDMPNLHFLWLPDLENCTTLSWSNTPNLRNINIAGMHQLSHYLDITGKPCNALLWIIGTNITSQNLDDILIYMSGLNIPPLDEYEAGPGAIIYGPYEDVTAGPLTPTSASLGAYNDLVSRGYTIIGATPGA